ncbi:hypothetical protein HNR39_002740 [Glaciimonas immobilis]|uniref:Uncharacterized protein n=1 Tax=Glaciimonas immobilis TaxID=728004 RepID=A0A840RUZ4_9BURK|nr:hypothetical protein [Glaciimonas immobilis]
MVINWAILTVDPDSCDLILLYANGGSEVLFKPYQSKLIRPDLKLFAPPVQASVCDLQMRQVTIFVGRSLNFLSSLFSWFAQFIEFAEQN